MTEITCPDCQHTIKLYTTEETAVYLGLSVAAVKYHVHVAHNLKPVLVGRTFLFTQSQLDQFQSTRRQQGRPIVR
jgi:hypothetical protein